MRNAKKLLENQFSANQLVEKLLGLSFVEQVCLLDSGGVSHLQSHFLIAGVCPLETHEISHETAAETLRFLDEKTATNFTIFTISYDFGLKLENIKPQPKRFSTDEPDVFLAVFECLIIHDYETDETFLIGDESRFDELENTLHAAKPLRFDGFNETIRVESNFTKAEYLEKIEQIKEFIRRGDTYQTNLTQQFTADLPANFTPQQIFYNLRKNHPAPFASFIQRNYSTIISASPERFFKVQSQIISTSPIKGTRPRGKTAEEDAKLRRDLLNSPKDRAENVMIVDLLRNDLGRVCEFGSVAVEKLCDLEEHPTLFHLVSTVSGKLRQNVKFSDIIRAVFPCGSITGAPKIRTMQIIDCLETANRALSMGAIGYSIPDSRFQIPNQMNLESGIGNLESDLSVAIRTMTIANRRAVFNVGGGIVIDSVGESEYEEILTKAKALLNAINGRLEN